MESLEVIIENESYRIIRSKLSENIYSVFNYAKCHVIKRNRNGEWEAIEHRFGSAHLPLNEIGNAIDQYSYQYSNSGQ
jgi:hypothetical protein